MYERNGESNVQRWLVHAFIQLTFPIFKCVLRIWLIRLFKNAWCWAVWKKQISRGKNKLADFRWTARRIYKLAKRWRQSDKIRFGDSASGVRVDSLFGWTFEKKTPSSRAMFLFILKSTVKVNLLLSFGSFPIWKYTGGHRLLHLEDLFSLIRFILELMSMLLQRTDSFQKQFLTRWAASLANGIVEWLTPMCLKLESVR